MTQIDYLQHIKNKTIADSREYDFRAYTPNIVLTAGTPATITLSPVPKGVNGTDSNHYLYITGGTGTAEVVLITGGTAIAEADSGTITFTPANNHSGAWTIISATAGIQEAVNDYSTSGGVIQVKHGVSNVYGTIWVPGSVLIKGAARKASTIMFFSTNTPLFRCRRDEFEISDLWLQQDASVTPLAGNCAIDTLGGDATNLASNFRLRDLMVYGFYDGIVIDGSSASLLTNISSSYNLQYGIWGKGSQGNWSYMEGGGNHSDFIHLTPGTLYAGSCPWIQTIHSFANGGWGLYSEIGVQLYGGFVNNDGSGCVCVNVTSVPSGANVGVIQGVALGYGGRKFDGSEGQQLGYSYSTSAPGVRVMGNGSVNIIGCLVGSNGGDGADIQVPYCQIIGGNYSSNGLSGVAVYNISITAANCCVLGIVANNGPSRFDGNQIKVNSSQFGDNSAGIAVYISSGTDVDFTSNKVSQAGAGVAFQADAGTTLLKGTNRFLGTETNNATFVGTTWT